MSSKTESLKRLRLADDLVRRFESVSKGVILAGSVAYGPNTSVRPDSDLDLVVFTKFPLKSLTNTFIDDFNEAESLKHHRFDGFCLKSRESDIPISLHVFDDVALHNITKSYITNLHVYRASKKDGSYSLNGFAGNSYDYAIKVISYPDLQGSRIMVPTMFRKDDVHYLGIHRDKILSGGKILFESENCMSEAIDSLWGNAVETLVDESFRRTGVLNLDKMNILNALARKDRFDSDVKQSILNRTDDFIAKLR